jgi:type IX secretion system PorP/SprF family membrane protein
MKLILSILLSFSAVISLAQDARYYQYDLNALYLNPALTGERVSASKGVQLNTNNGFRSSNASRESGNIVSSIGVDMPLSNRFSIGQFIGNNRSESGAFNTFNFLVSGAYKIINPANNEDKRCLSIGIQIGVLNTSMNTQNFTYATQYNPNSASGFDNSFASGENYTRQSLYAMDNNVGMYYRTSFGKKKSILTTGLSFYHVGTLNKAKTIDHTTDLRTNFHINLIYPIGNILTITPKFFYMNQSNAKEYNTGLLINFIVNKHIEPIIGLSWVYQKALVAQIGLKMNENNIFRVSYASSIGDYAATGSRGVEFSYVHISNRKLQPILQKSNVKEDSKEEKGIDGIPNPTTNDPEDIYYLLKMKNILNRLTTVANTENISPKDIQKELDKVQEELIELSNIQTSPEMTPIIDAYIKQIEDKLKILQQKLQKK